MMLSILLMILTIAKILAGSSREQYHIKGPDEYYTKELSEGQKKEKVLATFLARRQRSLDCTNYQSMSTMYG